MLVFEETWHDKEIKIFILIENVENHKRDFH